MELIVGGHGQGQMEYLRKNGDCDDKKIISGNKCGLEDIYECGIIDNFHEYVGRFSDEADLNSGFVISLMKRNKDIIIVTDEVGGGIVPIDRKERDFREIHGRLCCEIASQADRVVRVICGIGIRIK